MGESSVPARKLNLKQLSALLTPKIRCRQVDHGSTADTHDTITLSLAARIQMSGSHQCFQACTFILSYELRFAALQPVVFWRALSFATQYPRKKGGQNVLPDRQLYVVEAARLFHVWLPDVVLGLHQNHTCFGRTRAVEVDTIALNQRSPIPRIERVDQIARSVKFLA